MKWACLLDWIFKRLQKLSGTPLIPMSEKADLGVFRCCWTIRWALTLKHTEYHNALMILTFKMLGYGMRFFFGVQSYSAKQDICCQILWNCTQLILTLDSSSLWYPFPTWLWNLCLTYLKWQNSLHHRGNLQLVITSSAGLKFNCSSQSKEVTGNGINKGTL